MPHGHWEPLTFIASLRADKITVPCVLDGPSNSRSFTAYVEQFLVPTRRPCDVVILDNLGSHNAKPAREVIRNAGAKLKAMLRKAAERTVEATGRRIRLLLDCSASEECKNDLKHAGYASI